ADRQIVKIKPTNKATIQFSAFPGKNYPAFISEIAEEANPATGTFDIELTLDGYFPELKNGFVGSVQIFEDGTQPYYQIPITAMIEGNGKTARLYTSPDGQTLQAQTVQIQKVMDAYLIVNADQIPDRHWLITEGAAYLSTTDSIQIIQ
ncbi:MAG: hypothetical protein AAF598_04470, partial [Bacteroidota bacterium]